MISDKQIRDLQRLGVMPTGLVEYSTATLSDGLQRIGMRNRVLESAIRPLLPFTKMVGTAVTIKLAASNEPGSYAKLLGEAFTAGLQVPSPILVLESPPGLVGATVIGSGGAHVLRNQFGFAGCVIDGALRDTDDLKKMAFQVYARSIHPEYVFGIMRGVSYNQPVTVGGVTIGPGDVIVGDNDGVVAIPSGDLERVVAAANEILVQEEQILREIDGGTPYLEVLRRYQPEAFQGEKS
jgi:4-hydroxy-4-methyl-2-oxoglutarate aldolase